MATIVTRAGKGSALAHEEVDANFTNLNNDKVETSRLISAGTGLSGGGSLAADRAFSLSSGAQTSLGKADTAVQPARQVNAGTGLTGGGDLSADRTLSISSGGVGQVQIGANVLTPQLASVNGGQLAGYRNVVMNGDFSVWQRIQPQVHTSGGDGYTADRWYVGGAGGTGRGATVSQVELGGSSRPFGARQHLRWQETTAGSGYTSKELYQGIEGVETAAGRVVTISFWAKAGASLTLPWVYWGQYFGSGGSPSADTLTAFGSNVAITTSWTQYFATITVPSIVGKTFGTAGGDCAFLSFRAPTTGTFTLDIAEVQVEFGGLVTPFERRSFGLELQMCKRYYEHSNTSNNTFRTDNWEYADGAFVQATELQGFSYFFGRFRVEKAYEPAIAVWDALGTLNRVSFERPGIENGNNVLIDSGPTISTVGFMVRAAGLGSGAYAFCNWEAEAEI
jgi:hypothetical protein